MKAVVIIPTYNERENIKLLIDKLQSNFPKGWEFEIVVVDDNSPDGTARAVEEKRKKYKNVELLLRKKKEGLGAAYLAGMKKAFQEMKAELALVMDADLSHEPKYLPEFLQKISEGAEFVVGSRYIKGGAIPEKWALHRKLLSVLGNKIVSFLLLGGKGAITDWTSGYRAITKKAYEKVYPKIARDKAGLRGYTFNTAFAYYALTSGFKVSEVPIKFVDRESGESKLGLEYLFHLPLFLFKTRLRKWI